ncbi:MAG: HD domain-containing protein [Acidobacteriota bacterium]|nr:HD domain-containing protein [Acidobacteriota bacterium]
MSGSGVRLSEVMVALSLATDLGFGQPPEHMLRSARIAMRLGDRLGLTPADLAAVYDVGVLTYVGCPVYGDESSALFGDDIEFRSKAVEVDLAGFPAMVFMLRRSGYGTGVWNRIRRTAAFMATNGRALLEAMAEHCAAAGQLAGRLGLGDEVRAGLEQAYARWDGRGLPKGLGGSDVSLAARIAHVAEACEVFERKAGVDAAVEMVRSRSGSHFDPEVAAAVETDPKGLFDGIDEDTVDEVLDVEPVERPVLGEDELDGVLRAVGDFCDMRCPYFAGHAAGTAELAVGAAEAMQLPPSETRLLRRAALVHDVGRFGVPATVWDRPGPLSSGDRERMRMHAYLVERIFSRPEPLRRVGLLAATHHERMDGSGYHRGVGGAMLSSSARVLAAADAYHAMRQPRPHRPAHTAEEAARLLRAEASAGRLDPAVVDGVLSAAGLPAGRSRAGGPAGLTAREADVLALLAQGLPNKGIATQLGISAKTVGNHVEHIYSKLGVTNRAGAAMRAMQHGLVGAVPGANTP